LQYGQLKLLPQNSPKFSMSGNSSFTQSKQNLRDFSSSCHPRTQLQIGWMVLISADCLKFDAFVGFELVAPDVQKFVG